MVRLENVPRGQPICQKEASSPFDIGVVYDKFSSFSAQQKKEFIENVWSPRSDPHFEFPKTMESNRRTRRFNRYWLEQFPWLTYSKYLDGAFCLPCVFFAKEGGRVDKLVKSPLTFWTTALGRFHSHSNGKCEVHNSSVILLNNFRRTMNRETVPIDQQLDNVLRQQIAKK